MSNTSENLIEGRALFQTPLIDGKVYFINGVANKGFGPYDCKLRRFSYPDIYCETT